MSAREVQSDDLERLGTLIAEVDIGQDYEIDQAAIYQTDTGYILATASGCSCWSGEWSITEYETLADLWVAAHIPEEDGWQPFMVSWAGADRLFHQAFNKITGGGPPHNI
jgi:hypothetical protein